MAFRICMVGCGYMAREGHGPALARYAAENGDVELAACCDVRPEQAEAFARVHGFARHYADMEAMLERERPQGVTLAVPERLTARLATLLLEQGVPVLLEKPPGIGPAEALALRDVARRCRTPHRVAYNRRYMPLVEAFMEGIDRSQPVLEVLCDFQRHGRRDLDFSTTAIHGIDLVAVLGGNYRQVDYRYRAVPGEDERVAHVLLQARLASGASATLGFRPMAGTAIERYQVIQKGRTGMLELPAWRGQDAPGRSFWTEQGRIIRETRGGDAPPFVSNGFYAENAGFFDAVRGKAPLTGTLEDATDAVLVADAMRRREASLTLG